MLESWDGRELVEEWMQVDEPAIPEEGMANESDMDSATLAQGDDHDPWVEPTATEDLGPLSDEEIDFEPQDLTYRPGDDFPDNDGSGEKPTSASCDQKSHCDFVLEEFPGPAGSPIGVGNIPFNTFLNPSLPNPTLNAHPSVVDPELWELARWLMSSSLSAGAREAFFKLKYVSYNCVQFPNDSNHIDRIKTYLGSLSTNS
jgi:hypothetical protein